MPNYVFLVVFILIYSLICFYIAYNGWVWLKAAFSFRYKKTYSFLIAGLSSALFISYFIPSFFLEVIGGFWMAIVGYSMIILPLANVLYFLFKRRNTLKIGLGFTISAFFIFVLIYGSYNAWSPVVREYEVSLNEQFDEWQGEEMRILFVADLHLGNVIGERHLQRLVDITSRENPDLIFLGGDIINDNISPFQENELLDVISKMQAPLGVFAVPGNHDYYGGDLLLLRDEMVTAGFHFLMDEVVTIEDTMSIIGRHDYSNEERKSIQELTSEIVDDELPIFIIDHQPREIDVAEEAGAHFIFSGHTHRGQLMPANLITSALFENDWGHLQRNQLHSFTTSGFGFWGPALRIGSRSEVMMITVTY
ncbi:metallophosphoesterase [Alkalihalobacillus trypoxylicola]|uniref:Phosphoesterase n=1 Tax=Alkalihalobacillus trypoxylicola TaxID=519424 RepID=A0A162FCI3_9BACI|nr:metallophosphoesterase [Alkalihalobacillus trypoxylicola]KYG35289.1 phosphoesterase [Alkalihalobacillus trypoxylicola]